MDSTPRSFLFTTFDGGGNVAPMMSVVDALIARGHSVRVMSDDSTRQEVEAAGARFVPWIQAPNKAGRSRDTDPPDWRVSPEEGLIMLAEHFMGGFALAYAQDTATELDRERADLVVNFEMLLGVMTACEARQQKLALLSTCISMFPIPGVPPFGSEKIWDAGLPALNAARERLGLPRLAHLTDQASAASMRFLGTARAFDFAPASLPSDVRYIGPLIRDPLWARDWTAPWDAGDSRPLIVVAFSTSFQNHGACLQSVIDAAADLPVRVLVTLGGGAIRQTEVRAAANTVVVDSAPHELVMRDAAIVVTHGGHGTVMTALAHGVPMLVIPHGRDQGDNAVRVAERGAGRTLPNTSSAADMRAALRLLLERADFRAGAQSLGAAIREEMRTSTVIDDLESMAHSCVR